MAFLSLIARFGLDSTGFQLGLKQAESGAAKLSRTMGRLFGGAALLAFGRAAINAGDRLGDLADSAGSAAEKVQELDYIMGRFGQDFEGLQTFIEKLRQARDEALSGGEEMRKTFESIGIPAEALRETKDAAALLEKFGRGISGLGADDQSRILRDIGGLKAGPKLRAAIVAAGAGEESDFWRRMEPESVRLASQLSDAGGLFWRSLKAAGMNILTATEKYLTFGIPSRLLGNAGVTGQPTPAVAGAPSRLAPQQTKSSIQFAEELFKLQMESLPIEQRRAAMQKRINELTVEAGKLDERGLREEADKKRLEALGLFRDRLEIKDENEPKMDVIGGDLNALQRIGAQVSNSNEPLNVMREQLKVQRETRDGVKRIASNSPEGFSGP